MGDDTTIARRVTAAMKKKRGAITATGGISLAAVLALGAGEVYRELRQCERTAAEAVAEAKVLRTKLEAEAAAGAAYRASQTEQWRRISALERDVARLDAVSGRPR